jgi:DNA-binding NarL/FixJ family response regulator
MSQKAAIAELRQCPSAHLRVLLADDFEPWRSHVRSFLQSNTEWEIVAETCDRLEAIHRTQTLYPDVVILDVSMPRLDGLQAARKIHQISPDCAIVFLTENSDEDVIEAALEAGAAGYVQKRELAAKLMPTLQAALQAHL